MTSTNNKYIGMSQIANPMSSNMISVTAQMLTVRPMNGNIKIYYGNINGSGVGIEDQITPPFIQKEYCYYIRIEQMDGHCAWSSPIWFNTGRIDGIISESYTGARPAKEIQFLYSNENPTLYYGKFSKNINQAEPPLSFTKTSIIPDASLYLMISSGIGQNTLLGNMFYLSC